MASRFLGSCSLSGAVSGGQSSSLKFQAGARPAPGARLASLVVILGSLATLPVHSQILLKATEPGEVVMPMPSDLAIFEASYPRKDLPCTVAERKPELGFDLRFHAGYEVTIPLKEIAGDGEILTVVFRVRSQKDEENTAYFVQHFRSPSIDEDAKGDALLDGVVDLGEGSYHVDWLMRDRAERICSSSWDLEAVLGAKDRPMDLFVAPNQISEFRPEPFVNDRDGRPAHLADDAANVKVLVNFAPQNSTSAALQRSDTEALVSILKTIQRDPRVGRISLVAFNMSETRIVYRQDSADQIDFPALGRALQSMKLGTITVQNLGQKHSETDFLEGLIEKEVAASSHPDAVIFAGPKAMLNADVPQDDLRRIGNLECPVFYMNYNLNPQAVPWKDSISHAIKAFRGTEYTISRPRDLWFSTSEMVNRILRSKHARASAPGAPSYQ